MVKNTKSRIQKLKRKLEKLEELDQAEGWYIEHLQKHRADAKACAAAMRKLLFKKVTGHGEHHPSVPCKECMRLRVEISRELKGG